MTLNFESAQGHLGESLPEPDEGTATATGISFPFL